MHENNARAISMEYLEYRDDAITVAKQAGDIIKAAWNKPRQVTNKGLVDLVTETDQACEDLIKEFLATKYPKHLFIGEEGSATQGFTAELTNAPTWIVDPLDGTTNFVHTFPFVCVCIGLVINKAVCYSPGPPCTCGNITDMLPHLSQRPMMPTRMHLITACTQCAPADGHVILPFFTPVRMLVCQPYVDHVLSPSSLCTRSAGCCCSPCARTVLAV